MHTSGFLLVWTLHYLMIHPKVMEQLVTEMKNSVGTDRHKKMKDYVFSDKTLVLTDRRRCSLRVCVCVCVCVYVMQVPSSCAE